jgi:Type I restriction enzyme R protein N terminus (HSDR_N)
MSQPMTFRQIDFNFLGESDVREEVLAPLIAHLGYFTGTQHTVIREYSLKYEKLQLGRPKESDPTVRGRADYICRADGLVCWTIEAKAPHEPLDARATTQAWTYANHPEVRAVYFVLCNGRELAVFQTNHGPDARPLFQCSYEELKGRFSTLINILGPKAILRDHPKMIVDTGDPLAPGLRSTAAVTNGRVLFDRTDPLVPPINGMLMSITSGQIDRDANGRLRASLLAMVANQSLQKTNERFGLDQMCLISDSCELSQAADNLTVFRSTRSVTLPAGETALNMMDWTMVTLPFSISASVSTEASGHLKGRDFVGRFTAKFVYTGGFSLVAEGDFILQLS